MTKLLPKTRRGGGRWQAAMSLVAIFALALAIRVAAHQLEGDLSRDSISYINAIGLLSGGADFSAVVDSLPDFWAPPLPLAVPSMLTDLGLSPERAGIVFNLLCGSLTAAVIAWGMLATSGRRFLMWGGGLVAAVQPSLVNYSIHVQREAAYTLMFAALLFAVCMAAKTLRRRWAVAAGVALGLTCLCRYEGVELFVVIPALGCFAGAAGLCPWRRSLELVGVCVLTALATAVALLCWYSAAGVYWHRMYFYLEKYVIT